MSDEWEIVDSRQGWGHGGHVGVKIMVLRDEKTRTALANISDASGPNHGLSPLERERAVWWRVGELAERIRCEQALRLDPEVAARAAETRARIERCFSDAGCGAIFVEPIPNEYWRAEDPHAAYDPWFTVTTRFGRVKIGWRKRVLVLDWSQTIIEATADALFAAEQTTRLDRGIHAWGYEKATEYLRALVTK